MHEFLPRKKRLPACCRCDWRPGPGIYVVARSISQSVGRSVTISYLLVVIAAFGYVQLKSLHLTIYRIRSVTGIVWPGTECARMALSDGCGHDWFASRTGA